MAIRKEVQLYGEAEAIRVLYQTGVEEPKAPKPPRPNRRRGLWVGRLVERLSPPSLPELVGSKA